MPSLRSDNPQDSRRETGARWPEAACVLSIWKAPAAFGLNTTASVSHEKWQQKRGISNTSLSGNLGIGLFSCKICFPGGSAGKEFACSMGDLGSIPGLGRSPGEGNSYPLQYSGLENSMDCIVHGVVKSQTQLSNFYFLFLVSYTLPPSHFNISEMEAQLSKKKWQDLTISSTDHIHFVSNGISHLTLTNDEHVMYSCFLLVDEKTEAQRDKRLARGHT